jgi:hypothetical protein
MFTLLAVDPGIRGCGLAIFYDGVLSVAVYEKNPIRSGAGVFEVERMARAAVEALGASLAAHGNVIDLALEFPRIYTAGKGKGDPNDLTPLAGVVSAIAAHVQAAFPHRQGRITTYSPRDWKGTIDPEKLILRVRERLTPEERGAVLLPCASLAHNVWDAIGIGLAKLGRLDKQRVFPRQ